MAGQQTINMEQLTIAKKDAVKAFKEADAEGKKLLSNLFNKEKIFGSPMDRFKTFEDVLATMDEIPENVNMLLTYNGNNADLLGAKAFLKATLVTRALNDGWVPNWDDTNEYKWWPWFNMKSAGFGLSYSYFGSANSSSVVGSRLCFKSEELSNYAAKQFESIYKDLLTINQ